MKKVMIALAAVAFVAVAQAATVSWNSGTLRAATSVDGGWGTTGSVKTAIADSTLLVASVYLVDFDAYTEASSMASADIFAKYSVLTATNKGELAKGTGTNIGVTTEAAVATDYYAVVIYTYTDTNYGDMYIATTASIAGTSIDNPANTYNVASIGSSAGAATGWQTASIPEPTSALMLLVGLAGLALKRKIA